MPGAALSVTSGYLRSRDSMELVTMRATRDRLTHLWSAGMIYQGA